MLSKIFYMVTLNIFGFIGLLHHSYKGLKNNTEFLLKLPKKLGSVGKKFYF